MDFITPAVVGVYAAGGLYVARYLRGSSREITMTALGAAAAIGAASAVVAPQVTSSMVCGHSPGAPIVEAAASSAVSWAAVWALADMESANMFVPVQMGAHLTGAWAAKYVRAYLSTMNAKSDDESMDSF
jgi:hypothetical protein